jgi:hypothetical protein
MVGNVFNTEGLGRCTVETSFRERRTDRKVGVAPFPVGPFVVGYDERIYPYIAAEPARHDGAGVVAPSFVAGSTDAVTVALGGGSDQTFQITAGSTIAEAAAELNGLFTDIRVEVDADGHANLVAGKIGMTMEIKAVANDAYAQLGWTVGVYQPTVASHDGNAVKGLAITAAAAVDDPVETVEY